MADLDGFDDPAFAGDDLAAGSGGERDDEVAGGVPAAVGGEVGSVEAPARSSPSLSMTPNLDGQPDSEAGGVTEDGAETLTPQSAKKAS